MEALNTIINTGSTESTRQAHSIPLLVGRVTSASVAVVSMVTLLGRHISKFAYISNHLMSLCLLRLHHGSACRPGGGAFGPCRPAGRQPRVQEQRHLVDK